MVGIALGAAALAGGWIWLRAKSSGIDYTDSAQVAQGKALYLTHCASCHGEQLQGEPDWQTRKPTGELPAPPHDSSGHTWHHPEQQLFAIIKHGMARFAPPGYKTAMPSFVGVMTDAEIRSVLAYIESTWPPEIHQRRAALDKR
ncbi:cytochrome C [Paramagnetospirillum kuznetsovii]|uniref:Cytochrome C n=1 Tax=Paramagnetospirillum kuznetsovii TaxID=2053833 RepID=A0A364P0E6_9PROT|nr:cytochrome c [Paramagnetospirillum kuznetsovii]RAU22720.1 cytochrome C [Paramagnetospirillum kuznetsovii]